MPISADLQNPLYLNAKLKKALLVSIIYDFVTTGRTCFAFSAAKSAAF
jgi:hypothetical protein